MSAILSTDTLNDFISPSVVCIKPIETLPSAQSTSTNEVQIYDPSKPTPSTSTTTTTTTTTAASAQISLTDCLACSGCVTSAEAILVSLQSHTEVLNALDSAPSIDVSTLPRSTTTAPPPPPPPPQQEEKRLFIASISPQTLASLSTTLSLPLTTTTHLVTQFLCGPQGLALGGKHGNKFQWLVNTDALLQANLVLGAEEVLLSQKGKKKLPVLASSCPGWICYAEKTHPHILPHLSRLKSPQALTGTMLKTVLSRRYGIGPDRIWHVAIMPCFDKKLEASREELTDSYWDDSQVEEGRRKVGIRDVDCVITSKELIMLASTRGVDLSSLPRTPISPSFDIAFPDAKLDRFLFPHRSSSRLTKKPSPEAGSSGGHLWYLLKHVQSLHPQSTITSTRGRNADVIDYTVTSSTGEVLFRAARYYGFRNIQNLVRRLKPARPSRMPGGRPVGGPRRVGKDAGSEQAYVEVMACPGGCTNGGGQVKVDDPIVLERIPDNQKGVGPQEQKEWLAHVDEAYFSSEEDAVVKMEVADDTVEGNSSSYIKDTLAHWAALTGFEVDKLVYTSYREVFSDVGKNVGDTERVVQLAGKVGGGW